MQVVTQLNDFLCPEKGSSKKVEHPEGSGDEKKVENLGFGHLCSSPYPLIISSINISKNACFTAGFQPISQVKFSLNNHVDAGTFLS